MYKSRVRNISSYLCLWLIASVAVSSASGQSGDTDQEIPPAAAEISDLKTHLFQGFILYVDLEVDTCSARFSEINAFEKIKGVFSELQYTLILSATDRKPTSFEGWIRDHVFADFDGKVLIDQGGFFRLRYGLGPGSKLFFYNRKKELVYTIPMTTRLKGRDYLEMFNDWY